MRLEPALRDALDAYVASVGAAHGGAPNRCEAVRLLMRDALHLCGGEHSCAREAYFRALAEAREKLAAVTSEVFPRPSKAKSPARR